MKLKDIDHLVWDLDGTIIDSFTLFSEIVADTATRLGYPVPTREQIFHNFHGQLEDTFRAIIEELQDDQMENFLAAFLEVQGAHYAEVDHLIFPDALGLMKRAHEKKVTQMIVTNRMHEGRGKASPFAIVKTGKIDGYISQVVTSESTGFAKPDSRIFGGEKPEGKIIVVGDQHVDAELARNIHAKAILVNRHPEDIAHLERLGDNWQSFVTVVASLDDITFG